MHIESAAASHNILTVAQFAAVNTHLRVRTSFVLVRINNMSDIQGWLCSPEVTNTAPKQQAAIYSSG